MFWDTFLNQGYESLKRLTENVDMLTKKYFIFSFSEKNHWFLGIFHVDDFEFIIYDPNLDLPEKYFERRNLNDLEKQVEKDTRNKTITLHVNTLQFVYEEFIMKIIKKEKYESRRNITYSIVLPPQIPRQVEPQDCGIFLLQFAKHICFNKEINFSSCEIGKLRLEMKDELNIGKLFPTTADEPILQDNVSLHIELKMLSFINPSRTNLCFSNAVTSALLNIPILAQALAEIKIAPISNFNKIIAEIRNLSNLQNYRNASTKNLRNIVTSLCCESEEENKNYSNNAQHDAGEFFQSVLEHMFEKEGLPPFFDEKMFGGLYQDEFSCKCGSTCESPIQKLSEILPVDISKPNVQDTLDQIFKSEEVQRKCMKCNSRIGIKKMKFVSDPSTLILLLKRYEFDKETNQYIKKHDEIVCPQVLTLPSGTIFTMSAVINHLGETPKEGHYNVILYDKINDMYVSLDDTNITKHSSIPEITCKTHYIAVYHKI
jgi:ubiquitin C-terminal hydrolase